MIYHFYYGCRLMYLDQYDAVTRENLRQSNNDGRFFSIMAGMAEYYFPAFAVFCGLSTQQVGMLMSLPHFLGNTLQTVTTSLLGRRPGRLNWIVFGAALQGTALLPLAGAMFMPQSSLFIYLLMFCIIYFSSGIFIAPLWNAMMGDIVPDAIRGRYFGDRNRMLGIITFLAMGLAGIILFIFRKYGYEAAGFSLLFGCGFLARLRSAWHLRLMNDPAGPRATSPGAETQSKPKAPVSGYLTLMRDARRRGNHNYLNFAGFFALINFSVYIAGPYFAVYMLKELHFNYLEFTLSSMAMMVAQFMTMSHWGRLSDRFGNRVIIVITGVGVIIAPLIWVFSKSLGYVLFIQIVAGSVWSGFSLCSSNYLFDSLEPEERAFGFSLSQFMNGIAIFGGAALGGVLATHYETVPHSSLKSLLGGYNLRPLMLISCLGRLAVFLFFFRRFRELRISHPRQTPRSAPTQI